MYKFYYINSDKTFFTVMLFKKQTQKYKLDAQTTKEFLGGQAKFFSCTGTRCTKRVRKSIKTDKALQLSKCCFSYLRIKILT